MATKEQAPGPAVGSWYLDDLGRRFEVLDLDREAGLIQVRYEDGSAGELDVADWRHAMVEHAGPPGAFMTEPGDEEA